MTQSGGKRRGRKPGPKKGKGQSGAGFMDVVRKANDFLKSNKVISRGAKALGGLLPPQYGAVASTVGDLAGSLGYGRRRRMRGRGMLINV